MLRMKRCLIILCLFAFVFFAGCNLVDYTYEFEQSFDNIVKVEVCRYSYADNPNNSNITPITELDLEIAKVLLADITALTCHQPFGDHSRDYGEIVLHITYANGEAEIQGRANSARVDINGKWWIKTYYFNSAQWCAVLTKYVNREMVPELDKYLE